MSTPDSTRPEDELWCPRRGEGPAGRWFAGPDEWRERGGLIGQEALGLSCSFCGSLHPARFLRLVRDGWIVGPTDKSYKAYLRCPPTEQSTQYAQQQWIDGPIGRSVAQRLREDGCASEQLTARLIERWRADEQLLIVGTGPEGKFYFQHLSAAQRTEFIELYNSRHMVLGYPGAFYVRPYFCRPAEPEAESPHDPQV